jgi:hypothetical protein
VGRRTGLLILTLVAVAAAACTSHSSTASRASTPTSAPAVTQHSMQLPAAPAVAKDPKQRRGQFEQLLGQHTLLAVRLMRSVVAASPDFRQAAVASLQVNTDALGRLVVASYGDRAGDRFKQLWQRHVTDLFSYANAVASRDESAKQAARAALMADSTAYGSWFASASKGRVTVDDAVSGVRMHVEELMRQIDVYAAGDYQQAYRIEREAFEHMFAAGAALAKASVTPEQAVALDTAPDKLRSAFAMLLGEHMELIVDAQRATFVNSPEFKAAAAQLEANTAAITQAMGAIVGPTSADNFQSAWADHVDGLMAYTAAVAAGDKVKTTAAERNLNAFAFKLALYFNRILKDQLAVNPVASAISMHDEHLIAQVNAYAAKDYDTAQLSDLQGYQQMLGVANILVDAIQHSVKSGLPVGGAGTGGGGTALCRR